MAIAVDPKVVVLFSIAVTLVATGKTSEIYLLCIIVAVSFLSMKVLALLNVAVKLANIVGM